MNPRIVQLAGKVLIGISIEMSFSQNRTGELWKLFRSRDTEVKNRISTDFISLQHYPCSYFDAFGPDVPFLKFAGVEVDDVRYVPDGMHSLMLPKGLYAVFDYKGNSADPSIFQYIYGDWIPNSEYELDDRPHFEVLGARYANDDPSSEEEVWIPIKKK